MQDKQDPWRQCPTRPDGSEVLIEHRIAIPTCQERQRKQYHKCFQCVHRNAGPIRSPGKLPSIERPNPVPAVVGKAPPGPVPATAASPRAAEASPSTASPAKGSRRAG